MTAVVTVPCVAIVVAVVLAARARRQPRARVDAFIRLPVDLGSKRAPGEVLVRPRHVESVELADLSTLLDGETRAAARSGERPMCIVTVRCSAGIGSIVVDFPSRPAADRFVAELEARCATVAARPTRKRVAA